MSFLTELLEHYHLTLKDLGARNAPGSFDFLKRPDDNVSFQQLICSLENIISKQEKTVIYGDYDVDGLTSTAILKLALDERGLNPGFFIPSRYVEGYGLNGNRVSQFHLKGYQNIITVDNGISAYEAIRQAKLLGMKVYVIDHHEIPDKLPPFDGCFHQFYSQFLTYNCSAASLAYFVAASLLKRDDAYLASLAGLGVFSDVMPLQGNNLIFAKLMLVFLQKEKYPNLLYLLNGQKNISYKDVNFSLISSLNSVGRIKKDSLSTNQACRFLLERQDRQRIEKLGKEILLCNEQKKEIVKNVTFDDKFKMETSYGICLLSEHYSGLTGLFANKILREKKVSACVFAPDEQDKNVLVSSLRVKDGFDCSSFLKEHSDLFLAYGGHKKAAGFSIRKEDYFKVCTLLQSEFIKQSLDKKDKEADTIDISLDEVTMSNYHVLEQFMPFGESFEEPLFKVTLPLSKIQIAKSGKVAFAYSFDQSGKVVFFNQIDEIRKRLASLNILNETSSEEKEEDGYLEITGSFSSEEFQGKQSCRIVAETLTFHP